VVERRRRPPRVGVHFSLPLSLSKPPIIQNSRGRVLPVLGRQGQVRLELGRGGDAGDLERRGGERRESVRARRSIDVGLPYACASARAALMCLSLWAHLPRRLEGQLGQEAGEGGRRHGWACGTKTERECETGAAPSFFLSVFTALFVSTSRVLCPIRRRPAHIRRTHPPSPPAYPPPPGERERQRERERESSAHKPKAKNRQAQWVSGCRACSPCLGIGRRASSCWAWTMRARRPSSVRGVWGGTERGMERGMERAER